MKCPICSNPLDVNGEDLTCPQAHGIFMTGLAFNKATGIDPRMTRRVVCPSCSSNMNSMSSSGGSIAICPSCRGVWTSLEEIKKTAAVDPTQGFAVKWAPRKIVCPTCRKALNTIMTRGVEIDYCDRCGGIWLDSSEYEMLTGIDYKITRRLSCPGCSGSMAPGLTYGVEIDVCPKCSSVWLDSGEKSLLIDRVMANAASIGQSPSTPVTPGVQAYYTAQDAKVPDETGTIADTAESGNTLEQIMAANTEFMKSGDIPEKLPGKAMRRVAIVTCMDPRLSELLEYATGLYRGDAYIIRNAGGTSTDTNEVERSLAVALFASDIEEIIIMGHTDCAMAKVTSFALSEGMRLRGVNPQTVVKGDVRSWLGGFATETDNVKTMVDRLRESPIIPQGIPIHGMMIDSNTGKLEIIIDGYRHI